MEAHTKQLEEGLQRDGAAPLRTAARTGLTARDLVVLRDSAEAAIAERKPEGAVAVREKRYRRLLALADMVAALATLVLCATVGNDTHVAPAILLGLPLVVLASKIVGLYDRDELRVRKTTIDEAPSLFHLATLYTLVLWMLDDVIIRGVLGPQQALGLWGTLFVSSLVARRVARFVARRVSPSERLLLLGGDAATHARLEDKLRTVNVDAELVGRLPIDGLPHDAIDEDALAALIADLDVHRVLVVPDEANGQVTLDLVRMVKGMGVRVSIVPHVMEVVGTAVVFDDLGGMTLLGVREFQLSRSSQLIKRGFDLAGATVMLLALAPFIAVAAAAIKLDSRGPVFFRQERVGRHGRGFRMFKFRTMCVDAEERKADLVALNEAVGLFKIADDPRITRVGRLLRRTALDELPQLLNVLRGEMSLVGPRPLIADEDATITGYDRRRLALTPGMTGHWQIMGSARVPLHEMVKIDYLYIATWSLFEDVKILARTVPFMLLRRGL